MATYEWRCSDATCPHATAGFPESGDQLGLKMAKEHMQASGHPPAYFFANGEPVHKLDQTWAAWAARKRLFDAPPVEPPPFQPDPAGGDDEDELIGEGGDGDLPDDEDDDDPPPAGAHPAGRPQYGRGAAPAVAGGYAIAVSFPLSHRTLMAVDCHFSEFAGLYVDGDGNDLPYADRLTLYFGRLVARDMVEHPERYPLARYLKADGIEEIQAHYRFLSAQLTQLDVHRADLARREAAVARLESERGGAAGGR